MSNEILTNEKRVGGFTSSLIFKLCTSDRAGNAFGAPALTYIQEKKYEVKLGRSLDTGANSQAISWGTFMEQRVFNLIGFEYLITSDETDEHPIIKGWSGSKDLIVPKVKVSDIKCYQLKNFCAYADALATEDLEHIKKNFPKEYWQLVSNAIINEVPNAEAILYAPNVSELEEIRQMAFDYEGEDQYKYRFIAELPWYELPVIPDDSGYKNLNTFEFVVPENDIEFLTDRVKMAIKLRDKC